MLPVFFCHLESILFKPRFCFSLLTTPVIIRKTPEPRINHLYRTRSLKYGEGINLSMLSPIKLIPNQSITSNAPSK